MMSSHDIQMCVADVLRDDALESFELIIRALNDEESTSWRKARGASFNTDEVRNALVELISKDLVTPCAEEPPTYECKPILIKHVGTAYPWESLWFHLEPAGHQAVERWWQTEGRTKYPVEDQR